MTKQNRLAFCEPALMAKPRQNLLAGDRVGDGFRTFADQIQLALARAIAHAGEIVRNDSEPHHPAQAVIPNKRIVAVHFGQELCASRALKGVFNLPCAVKRVLHGPHWRYARVHHGDAIFKVGERLKMQPLNQLVAIRRRQDVVEIIFSTRLPGTG